MWDSNAPLQLLNSMPKQLEDEHLEKLQLLFEADKYKNQLIEGVDLCGSYAPFCNGCDKIGKHPCAKAYVTYMKQEGADVEIASDNELQGDTVPSEEENEVTISNSVPDEHGDNEKREKTKIRIAIARKKIL